MMGSGPVFQSSFDLAIWKKLSRSGTSKFSIGRMKNTTEVIADEVIASKVSVNSAVLVRLMDALYDSGSQRLRAIIPDIVAKRRSSDSAPALEAALLLQKMGNLEDAEAMFKSVRDGQDISLMSIVNARLLLEREDKPAAKKVLLHGRCSDPLDQRIYKLLEEADPAGGWMYYRNIELLYAERNTVACGTDEEETPQQKLYKIYCIWYSGDHNAATEALINSPEYIDKSREYMLAAARMSADESDWYSAETLYDDLVRTGCTYITCEAARVCLNEGKVDKALTLYRDAEATDTQSPVVMEGLIDVYTKMGRKEDAANYVLFYLDTERADLDAYLRYADYLVSESMNAHAEPVLRKILLNYPENVEANILLSKNDIAMGNLPAALEAASAAVKYGSKDLEANLQRAKVLFAMGKIDKSMKESYSALKMDPTNTEIMILIKDIYSIQGKKQKAMAMCDKILEVDPDNAKIILESSQAKLAKGDTEGSLSSYRRAILADPRPENFITVIKSLMGDEMYKEVVDLSEETESEYGSIATVRRLRGNAEFALGEFLKASASFAAAAVLDPLSPIIWHSKGMADEAADDLDSAEDAYNRAVLMDLDKPEYWISKASVQERKGDLHGAVESLNRVIELKPESVYALVKKGMIFARSGKYKEAIYFIDMAIMVNVWDKSVYNIKKEICIHSGMYKEAISVCSDIWTIDPKDVYAVVDAADCMMKLGDRSAALSLVNSKLTKDPSSLQLLFSKKIILTSMGNHPELISICYRILEKDPDNRSVKMDLVQALTDNGDMVSADRIRTELYNEDVALETAENSVKTIEDITEYGSEEEKRSEEEDAEALFDIARSLYSLGDLIGAARMADRALELKPEVPEYILFRVKIHTDNGDERGAATIIEEGLSHSKQDPELWEKYGDLKTIMGDPTKAVEAYQNAILYGEEDPKLYVKLGDIHMAEGDIDEAISDYTMAVSKSGLDNTARIRLASAYCEDDDSDNADKIIDIVRSDEPENAEALVIKAKIYSKRGEQEGVMEMYKLLLMMKDPEQSSLEQMSEILAGLDRPKEATVLIHRAVKASEDPEDKTSEITMRHAERLLRRAYVSKRSLDDPGIENMLETDQETANKVMIYLSNIEEYGPIIPGTPEFVRMEALSYDAVTRANLVDIDMEPIITIPCAFVAGGAKDADEAKALVSYIFEALKGTMRIDLLSEEVAELSSEVELGMSIYDIMKKFKIGVYSARAVKDLSNSTSGTS